MRLPLFLAISLVLLTACGQQSGQGNKAAQAVQQGPAAPAPVPANATAVRGTISIGGLSKLPGQLQLRLRLLDMSDPSVVPPVVAERIEPAPAQLPYAYALPYEAAQLNEAGKYVIEASLVAGDAVLYGTPMAIPVVTQGAGNNADIALERGGGLPPPDIAPADLLRQDFERLERSIGGMRRFSGERIDETVTVAWDAFADFTGVRFARQVVDHERTGTVAYRFAYKNGEPWVLARDQRGVVALVGWAPDGSLALNRDTNDRAIEESEVSEMRRMAEQLYKEAAAKRG